MYGNSIFLFESAGLCIAHLSHLHHLLTEQDLVLLGHIDVVMAPVDGVFTMSQPDMAAVLDQIHPRLVLPMHYFTRDVVDRFVALVRDKYAVRFSDSPTMEISRVTLPRQPTIVVLPGVLKAAGCFTAAALSCHSRASGNPDVAARNFPLGCRFRGNDSGRETARPASQSARRRRS